MIMELDIAFPTFIHGEWIVDYGLQLDLYIRVMHV